MWNNASFTETEVTTQKSKAVWIGLRKIVRGNAGKSASVNAALTRAATRMQFDLKNFNSNSIRIIQIEF